MNTYELPEDLKPFEKFIKKFAYVGSRIVCDPPVMDTDLDVICLIDSSSMVELSNQSDSLGWVASGSVEVENNVFSFSYVSNGINAIYIDDEKAFDRFVLAARISKRLNLLDKMVRVMVHQAIRNGKDVLDEDSGIIVVQVRP